MSNIQKDFCKAVLSKRIELKKSKEILKEVSISTIGRWQNGSSSPTLETVETLCLENGIELPFFFDGQVESLVLFNKKIGEKLGFKVQLIFE